MHAMTIGTWFVRSSVTLLLAFSLQGTAWSAAYQALPIKLKASQALPKEAVSGPGFSVQETVENDGLVNIYRVKTPVAGYRVEGTPGMMTMANELRAIQALEKLKGSETFTGALKKSALKPLEFGKGLVEDPKSTVKGVASGVGRFFGDVGRSVTSDDPHQQNMLETALGQAATKRHLAFQLGVDPYSNLQPLQAALNEVAWTSVAGGMPIKVLLSAVGGAAMVVKAAGSAEGMRALVRDKSPAELQKINNAKIAAMGAPSGFAEAVLGNPFYTPQEMTLMIGALEEMRNVSERTAFLEVASQVDEESTARFMRVRAQLHAVQAREAGRPGRFVVLNRVPLFLGDDGVLTGVFPFDHVAWTASLDAKEQAISREAQALGAVRAKQLVCTGPVSAAARQELETRGWTVRDRIGLEAIKVTAKKGSP